MRTKTPKTNRIQVITLGCSKNVFDSEVLMGQIKANGGTIDQSSKANVVVVNTCGFIENAKQESIDTIIEQVERKKNQEIDRLYVTGCLSQRYKKDLEKELPEVNKYFGTTDLPLLLKALGADYKHELVGERLLTTPKHYAYLKISEGCNRPCSFCAIPLMRLKHRSTPMEELVDQAKLLANQGVKEIIIIAQDSTYYGLDLYGKRMLGTLLEKLVAVEGIEWIRLHYAFPTGFPLDVLEVIDKHDKICNYLDIPLQHISDPILRSMRRGTTREKTDRLLKRIRDSVPNVVLRTTLIVGYPGETEQYFEELIQWVKEMEFERLGCFSYSHEEGTHAFSLKDDIPEVVKQKRLARVMEVQTEISLQKNQNLIGSNFRCIVDRIEGGYYVARTYMDSPDVDNEVLVDASSNYLKVGEFYQLKVIQANEFDLIAEPIFLEQNQPNSRSLFKENSITE